MVLCNWCQQNEVQVNNKGKPLSFCSKECRVNFSLDKREATNIQKYGTSNPMLLDSVKQKRDTTNIARYGTDKPFSLKEIQEKHKKTCIEKYGVPHSSQLDFVKTKQRESWKKYNNSHPFSDSEIRDKITNTMLDKYGVEHPAQAESVKEKYKATCLNKYGVPNAAMAPATKEKISMSLSGGASALLDNKEWLTNNLNKLGIRGVADALRVSFRCVRQYADKHQLDFRKIKSSFEEEVVNLIYSLVPDAIVVRNSKDLIGKEIDIYLPEYNLAIECNGTYWHSELNGRGRQFHLDRTKLCDDNGVRLIHLWEHQWLVNKPLLISRLKSLLKASPIKKHARALTVVKLSNKHTTEFLIENHIQGACSSSIRYGLVDSNNIVWAVMTFGKSRYNSNADYELLRFCSSLNTTVMGGASKLFARFRKDFPNATVISYSDRSFNTGNMYEKLGFTFLHNSPPAYFYTKNYTEMYSRVKFQKHKLSKLLENYDGSKSEWENMIEHGYDRIWDCGTSVWLWHPSD